MKIASPKPLFHQVFPSILETDPANKRKATPSVIPRLPKRLSYKERHKAHPVWPSCVHAELLDRDLQLTPSLQIRSATHSEKTVANRKGHTGPPSSERGAAAMRQLNNTGSLLLVVQTSAARSAAL